MFVLAGRDLRNKSSSFGGEEATKGSAMVRTKTLQTTPAKVRAEEEAGMVAVVATRKAKKIIVLIRRGIRDTSPGDIKIATTIYRGSHSSNASNNTQHCR